MNPNTFANGLIAKDIKLSEFNRNMYEEYFVVWRKGSDAVELNSLSKNAKVSLDGGFGNPLLVF